MNDIMEKLRDWRSRRSIRDGVEPFRILSNETLKAIADAKPKGKEDLTLIKGFKDKKFAKYGKEILEIINNGSLFEERVDISLLPASEKQVATKEERIFTVSQFLDLVNIALGDFRVKIQGEISSVDERGGVIYFSLKDKNDGSMIRCLIWQSNYRMSGVKFEEGLEVMLYGSPSVWKPTGSMSFKAETVELVGEGALKKAYEELKKRLEKEGLFGIDRKKTIPEYPEKIGLITSKTGAVIHDFLNNIGKFGYKISLYDSRVEGALAVPDLMKAINYFKNKDIDVLVVIRGGGSLESLQAFNNEALTREISDFPKPVICGIGHDKDIPLFSLACDLAVSTPTAVTKVLNSTWDKALSKVQIYEKDIFNNFNKALTSVNHALYAYVEKIKDGFGFIFEKFAEMRNVIRSKFHNMEQYIKFHRKKIDGNLSHINSSFLRSLSSQLESIRSMERAIQSNNPERQLKLGYALIRRGGKLIKSVQSLSIGNIIEIKVADGDATSEIKSINNKQNDQEKS